MYEPAQARTANEKGLFTRPSIAFQRAMIAPHPAKNGTCPVESGTKNARATPAARITGPVSNIGGYSAPLRAGGSNSTSRTPLAGMAWARMERSEEHTSE